MGDMFKKSETKQVSTLDKSQQAVAQQLAQLLLGTKDEKTGQYVGGKLQTNATKFKGQLAPAYAQSFGTDIANAITANLKGSNQYNLSPDLMEKRFRDSVVNPSLKMYQESIAPAIRESFGTSGAFSSRVGTAQANALNTIASQNASDLANMQWNAEQLRTQQGNNIALNQLAAAQLANSIKQNSLNMRYQDFLRTAPENSPYLNMALQLIQNQQTGMVKQNTGFGNVMNGLGSALMLGGATGTMGMGTGALMSGAILQGV